MLRKSVHEAPPSNTSTKYHRLSSNDDGFIDSQFIRPPLKIPYKAILLACALFAGGSLLIIIGALLYTEYIDIVYADRMWPLFILGSLMFIPGSYHVVLAYKAWKGYEGYSFEDIPDFD